MLIILRGYWCPDPKDILVHTEESMLKIMQMFSLSLLAFCNREVTPSLLNSYLKNSFYPWGMFSFLQKWFIDCCVHTVSHQSKRENSVHSGVGVEGRQPVLLHPCLYKLWISWSWYESLRLPSEVWRSPSSFHTRWEQGSEEPSDSPKATWLVKGKSQGPNRVP